MRRSPNVIPCLWPGFTFGFAVSWRASCFVAVLRESCEGWLLVRAWCGFPRGRFKFCEVESLLIMVKVKGAPGVRVR